MQFGKRMLPSSPLSTGPALNSATSMMSDGPPGEMFSSMISHSSSEFSQQIPGASEAKESHGEDSLLLENNFKTIFLRDPDCSLYDMDFPERYLEDLIINLKEDDLSPFLPKAPPTASRTDNWMNDALEKAGEISEAYQYPAIKILLYSHSKLKEKDDEKGSISDAILLVSKELKDARSVRIQGRFGFRAAAQMKESSASSLQTQRQSEVLEEWRKTEKSQQFKLQTTSWPMRRSSLRARTIPTRRSVCHRFFQAAPRLSRLQNQIRLRPRASGFASRRQSEVVSLTRRNEQHSTSHKSPTRDND
ncbi:uncharacterized protein MONOS_11184 [Monocercomonoides exilis]|uniref:uncharacterized protein n=1 Tax=Monocercomonoides exilis TaxID=2049356 RepID=UPI00355949D5|nr:hypothetical protein MONOS_11184 [Monocercomonoides exilis]|eukprot:MONOS_11184.1-p1 / transcript=MONOS_11184.1 / gene=MONOS_11184 / organism=Monocercomonoides_exilis_PA203 / gene_product=unspecified product / transcript_product=unspecified product / location=Mono_scaffold00547:32737-33651(-) / protein_length=305 / sequence_SO=supercontig / SO=protein_coding / is_pseudo=false